MYLTAIIDWYSRFIVGWALSDTLETAPVLAALEQAIEQYGTPSIINSDQGSQFTSAEYTAFLKVRGSTQSMNRTEKAVHDFRSKDDTCRLWAKAAKPTKKEGE